MNADEIVRELRALAEIHRHDTVPTFGVRIADMAKDCADLIESQKAQLAALTVLCPDIDEIQAECDAATPGPWYPFDEINAVYARDPYGNGDMKVTDIRGWGHLTGTGACFFGQDKAIEIQGANRKFIAHSRTVVPILLAEVRRLRAALSESQRREQAAVHDIELVMRGFCGCHICANGDCGNLKTTGKCDPKWRGPDHGEASLSPQEIFDQQDLEYQEAINEFGAVLWTGKEKGNEHKRMDRKH